MPGVRRTASRAPFEETVVLTDDGHRVVSPDQPDGKKSVLHALMPAIVGAAVAALAAPSPLNGQTSTEAPPDTTRQQGPRVGHGPRGVEIETGDGRFLIEIQPRLQFRYTAGSLGDTVLADRVVDGPTLGIRRARLKIGGHAFTPDLTYFFEYELKANALLDFRAQVRIRPWLSLKVGQWKLHFNRERVISSGRQQMMDRSILTPIFTVDRQQGASLYGRAQGRGAADFSYWATVATGTGRSGPDNDDRHPMFLGRLQWNALGDAIDFSGSDLAPSTSPAFLIAASAVTNRSPYTRFSQDGGGALPGYDVGEAGQFRVSQWMVETAFKYRGLSWQQEFHVKRIDDTVGDEQATLFGNYAQVGAVLGHLVPGWPRRLEVAVRHAFYDPDREGDADVVQELALAANWFFNDHLNKLTVEIAYLTEDRASGADDDSLNFRVQWDLSM